MVAAKRAAVFFYCDASTARRVALPATEESRAIRALPNTCTECGIYASLASVLFRYTVHVIGVDSLELAHVTGAAESSETFRKFEFEKEQ